MIHNKFRNSIMLACFSILLLLMVSIFVRFTTLHVLVKKMHMDNLVTKVVLYDRKDLQLQSFQNNKEKHISIDWEELFPFDSINEYKKKVVVNEHIIKKIRRICSSVEKRIDEWTNKRLVEYENIVGIGGKFDKLIGWNIVARNEYNGVIDIGDGQLAAFSAEGNIPEKINNTIEFDLYCKNNNATFFFVGAPSKIDWNNKKYVGLDFSNENANEYYAGLKSNGVRYIDLRENIHANGLVTEELFFRTDHHWLPETGFWATGVICEYLDNEGIVKGNSSFYTDNKWDKKIYENWFLGSRGKKVTLSRAKPDNISLYYPKFATKFNMIIQEREINMVGDFNIFYEMSHIDKIDYYHKNPYAAYLYGDQAYISIENINNYNGKKILVLKNSFANAVNPFLALNFRHMDVLDLRLFKGSVHRFIKETKPDVVMMLYHIEHLSEKINYDQHNSVWDFR